MFKRLFYFFFPRSVDSLLGETKSIRIKGIKFVIKRINVLNHLDGSKVLLQHFDTYEGQKAASKEASQINQNKIQEHYSHVLCSGVVSPKLSLKETQGSVLVDRLFEDWEIVNRLHQEIYDFTYGKKKVQFSS